jgi:hypothetical protein
MHNRTLSDRTKATTRSIRCTRNSCNGGCLVLVVGGGELATKMMKQQLLVSSAGPRAGEE